MEVFELSNVRKKNSQILFAFAFILAFTSNYLQLTVLMYKFPGALFTALNLLSILTIVFQLVLYEKFRYKEILIYVFLFLVFFINWYKTGYQGFIVTLFLAIGAKNLDKQFVLKVSSIVLFLSVSSTIFLSQLGIIENLIFVRSSKDGGAIRQSLGTLYPTILGSIIFFLVLQIVYLRKKNNLFDIGLVLVSAIMIDKVTDNRLVFFLLIVFSIFLFFDFIFSITNIKPNVVFKYIWIVLAILLPIVFVWICINYDKSVRWMTELNVVLSNRLRLSWEGFLTYPVTIFGQSVVQNGWGGGKGLAYGVKYFYLDSLPVAILLIRGAVIFVGYLIYNSLFIKKALEHKDVMLAVILTFIIAYDLVDDKSIYLSLNPFLILSFNYMFSKKNKDIEKGNNYANY